MASSIKKPAPAKVLIEGFTKYGSQRYEQPTPTPQSRNFKRMKVESGTNFEKATEWVFSCQPKPNEQIR